MINLKIVDFTNESTFLFLYIWNTVETINKIYFQNILFNEKGRMCCMLFRNHKEKRLSIVLIIILTFVMIISIGCIEGRNATITVEKLQSEPETYFMMSNETVNDFPHLKQALNSLGSHINTPDEEFDRLYGLLNKEHDTNFIQYNGDFYKIKLGSF